MVAPETLEPVEDNVGLTLKAGTVGVVPELVWGSGVRTQPPTLPVMPGVYCLVDLTGLGL